MNASLLILILAPLVGALTSRLLLERYPKYVGWFASLASTVSLVAAVVLFVESSGESPATVSVSFNWITLGEFILNWGFTVDKISAVMCLVVTGIGSLIHFYSIEYMHDDETPHKYFSYLNLFLFSMLVLVTGDSLPVLFVGWEGVGLCSMLLIGYWYEKIENSRAGAKAFIVNRIGDACFLIGIFILFKALGSVNFVTMKSVIDTATPDLELLGLAAFFLFLGACGKSAQIPLYVWLPDAMAGPTPVSALIHAATMVTAGVYLVVRMSFLYQVTPQVGSFVAHIGAMTALFAASIAVAQNDIKKILAYSTVSQLGFMFVAVGVGAYSAGMFHLVTHAFFKACLFLCAGSVIHALSGEQDIWKMGGLRKALPITFWCCLVSALALSGIPPFAGFFSKDIILFSAVSAQNGSLVLWILLSLASLLTAFYMTRFMMLVFFGNSRNKAHPHESKSLMAIPLVVLAIGAVVSGFLNVPEDLHLLHHEYLTEFLSSLPKFVPSNHTLSEHAVMFIALGGALVSIWIGFSIYRREKPLSKKLLGIDTLLLNKYWIDELYDITFGAMFRGSSKFIAETFDPKVIDRLVFVPGWCARVGSVVLGLLHVSSIQFSLFVMVLGIIGLLFFNMRGVL